MLPTDAPLKPEILTEDHLRQEAIGKLLDQLAWLMDRSIVIPGTNLRVGLDAILGLVPGVGDLICGMIQSGLVLTALHHFRVPKVVAARMAVNVLIDSAIGAIPGVGDAFDAVFKANTQNLKLLNHVRQLQKQGHPAPAASSAWFLVGVGAVLLLALGLLVVGFVAIVALVVKSIIH